MTPEDLTGDLAMLEIVTGVVFGLDLSIPAPPRSASDPQRALEASLRQSLARPPCGVAFSGGRDSSAVLASATATAREHQLPAPIPVTLRFPGVGDTDETSFQESTVRHLELTDWVRLEPGDSLDVLGALATAVTQRHGLLYPGNIHFLVPMLETFRGGSLLTGLGGDEVLEGHPNHEAAAMILGRRRPSQRLLRDLAKRYIFRERRRQRARESLADHFEWLLPQAKREFTERFVEMQLADALWAERNLASVTYRMRYLHRAQADLARLAAGYDVKIRHPLLAPEFVGAVARRLGRVGHPSRTSAMQEYFGHLLEPGLVQRTSKARFDDVFWTHLAASRFADLPLGPVSDYVDPSALLALWASDAPKGNTYLLAKYLVARSSSTDPSREGHTNADSVD